MDAQSLGFQAETPEGQRPIGKLGFVADPKDGGFVPASGGEPPSIEHGELEKSMQDPEVLKTVARVLMMPGRGFRGLGVLLERAMTHDGISKAMERAAAATEPGYKPKEGEAAGAVAGQMVGDTPLFAALAAALGPAAAALRLGPTATAAVEAGSGVAGVKALEDVAEKGETSARDVAGPALLGMLLGAGASKVSRTIGKAVDDAAVFTPEAEAALGKLDASGQRPLPEAPPSGPLPEVRPSVKPLEAKAGNIALSKLETTEDAKRVVSDVADQFEQMITEQGRGKVPWEKTEENAALLGLTPEGMAKMPGGRASTAEAIEAQKGILVKSAEEVSHLRAAAAEDDSSENLVKFMLGFRRHATLQRIFSGQVSEAGRALNILRKSTEAADVRTQNVKALLDALGGREMGEDLIRRLSMIDPADTFAVNRFIREANEAGSADKLYEVWLNSILSSPITHKFNVVSNAIFSASRLPERTVQSAVDAGFGAFTGKRTVFAGEVAHDAYGMVRGLEEGVRRGLHVLRHGMSEAQAGKLDTRTVDAVKGTLGSIARLPTRMLTAEDEFFKAVTGVGERAAQAYRVARLEKLSGPELVKRVAELEANPTPEIRAAVQKEELYRTFQTELGPVGKRLMDLRNEAPLMRWVLPFLRTPANVAKRGLERTPLNAFNIAYKALRREGPYLQGEAVKDVSNAAIGSMVAATAAYFAATDRVTGRAPRSAADKDAFYRQGKQPYSLKVGDAWYSYDRLEPWSMSLGLVADAIQEARDMGPGAELKPEAVGKALAVIPRNLSSKTFLAGISDAFDAISDPDRHGERWVSRFAGSMMPFSGALRFAAQVGDSTMRKPDTFEQAVLVNLPILSRLVPARRNAFGEKVDRPNDIFSLAVVNKTSAAQSKLEDELSRLGVAIGFPSGTINGHELSQAQYDRYLELSGSRVKSQLAALIGRPGWERSSDEGKREAMDRVIREARESARGLVAREFPTLGQSARR